MLETEERTVEIAYMENLQEQELKIEDTRTRLIALVSAKRFNMQDPDVISLSQKLDFLIAVFVKAKQLAK